MPDRWTLGWPVIAGIGILALAVLAGLALQLVLLARRPQAGPGSGSSKYKVA